MKNFFNDKCLFLRDQKVWILISKLIIKIQKQPTHNQFGAWSILKNSFRNHSWYKHHMAPVRWVQFEGSGPGQWSRYRFQPVRARSGVGIYIYFIFFLQIYKLRGSYIKECKNHLRKSKIFTIFEILFYLGVSCMICSGSNRFKLGF